VYRAYELPHRYLPFFSFFTLTEAVWPLFILGLVAAYRKFRTERREFIPALLILAWFLFPFLYGTLRTPPMYDGMRHFLFMLPPLFIFSGLAFEFLFEKLNRLWLNIALVAILLAPGIAGIIQLHPYEYAYYNAFIGGTAGAFRHYETEYWLTCYKQAVEQLDGMVAGPVTLYVHREAYIAAMYAAAGTTVLDERGNENQIHSGDYILINTRTNEDRKAFHDAPTILAVGRAGATFCVVRRIP